jgi:heterodisulfide reductase subunit C
MAESMDKMPHHLMRLAQTHRLAKAIASQAIWQCVSCQTCSSRCPQAVDCASVMDRLREVSIACDCVHPDAQRTVLFQQAFLDNIRRNGRMNELELIGQFKTQAFKKDLNLPLLFKDSMLAPRMIRRRKFHPFGEKVKDRPLVQRIFERCKP